MLALITLMKFSTLMTIKFLLVFLIFFLDFLSTGVASRISGDWLVGLVGVVGRFGFAGDDEIVASGDPSCLLNHQVIFSRILGEEGRCRCLVEKTLFSKLLHHQPHHSQGNTTFSLRRKQVSSPQERILKIHSTSHKQRRHLLCRKLPLFCPTDG